MARRSRSRFVRPPVRTKMWIGAGVGRSTITASSKTFVASLSAGALLLRPFTILRTRMLISLFSDQEAADEGPFGSYGRIVVTDTAASVGVTAIPDPGSTTGDPDADWHVHQPVWQQLFIIGAISAVVTSGPTNWIVDSKAMRKVGPDDNIVSMYSDESGVGSFLTTQGRTLIQLH